ncbi:hypothetical protein B0H14DRAFT_3459694 [Mycena olivaceomarginata]|nr:hypothetical protein B0H14DRAFT_3459694 [Mycena olivaceomarginata]
MDPIYLQDGLGNLLTPIWSKKDSFLLCSILAPPSSVAPRIFHHNDPVPHSLDAKTAKGVQRDLDFTRHAVWYLDKQHWIGWIPTGKPRDSPYETDPVLDLLEICFSRNPAPTWIIFYDAYDSDHQISPVERLAGCHLDAAWVQEASYLGDRLDAISRSLAENSEFYCRGPPMNRVGDVPAPVDTKALEVLFSNDEEAQEAASKARRELLSLLGFLSWMLSLVQLKDTKLSSGDQQYLLQLKLDERPKTGAVFDLTRDQHKINFPHWANNGVPFHYSFVSAKRLGGRDVSVEELPSYATWKGDLEGSDWLGQNLRAGKMGVTLVRVQGPSPTGVTIRVYAERFKALIRDTERETVFLALSDFAYQEVGESVPEQARYYESNTVAEAEISRDAGNRPSSEELHREGKHRNPDAPHAPLRRLAEAAALTLTSEAAGRVRSQKGRSSGDRARSLSSVRTAESDGENAWFEEEFQSAAGSDDNGAYSQDEEMGVETFKAKQDDTPFEASLDLAKEAVDALACGAPTVMEYEPKKAAYDPLSWNSDWLDRAYLVVERSPHLGTTQSLNPTPSPSSRRVESCKFVAELFAPDLAYRFVRGPSEQVSEFGKGKTTRLMIEGQSTLCISDQVSDVEVAILLGYVKGKNSDQERSLWPSQALLEQHSLHVRGYLSSGAWTVLEYLRKRIMEEKIYDWKSKAEWKSYLRGGAKGRIRSPRLCPPKRDFEEGWRILDDSFPADWQHAPVSKIVLPERFNPHARRN